MLNGMVERRMRQAILAVASLWYTAWVNAGQPVLAPGEKVAFSAADSVAFDTLDRDWQKGKAVDRTCDN